MSCHVSVIWEAGKFGKGETGYRLKVNEVKTLQSYCGFCGLVGYSIIYALESGWFDSLSGWPVWSSVSPGLCSSLSCLSLPISLKSGRNMSLGEDIKTTTANFVILKKKTITNVYSTMMQIIFFVWLFLWFSIKLILFHLKKKLSLALFFMVFDIACSSTLQNYSNLF